MTDSDDKDKKPVFDEEDAKKADLDKIRGDALHSDFMKYAFYNKNLGIPPEDIERHNQGLEELESNPIRAEELEKEFNILRYGKDYANPAIKAPITIREKNYQNFGIKADMFNHLPYQTVREIFFGIHNFNCPELYKYMNPTEVLGLWTGVDRKDDRFLACVNKDSIIDTLSALVSEGYNSSIKADKIGNEISLLTLSQKIDKTIDAYRTAPGDLKERFSYVENDTMEKVIEQIVLPRRHTEKDRYTAADFNGKNIIYDPNSDVTRPSMASKNLYAYTIMNIVSNIYKNSIVDKM